MAKFIASAGALSGRGRSRPLAKRGVSLRCPNCQSADVKKVSLVYYQGVSHLTLRSRSWGCVFGEGGPGFLGARGATRGIRRSELSEILAPPLKWSYLRLVARAAAVTLAGFAAYIVFVVVSTPPVSSLPVKLYVFVAPAVFLCLVFSVWHHNRLIHPRQFAEWDRSFLCRRCGMVVTRV
jgi:hypothetical protein